jgi:hypothetical protein
VFWGLGVRLLVLKLVVCVTEIWQRYLRPKTHPISNHSIVLYHKNRIRGKRAIMTIFEDGVKKEDVQLYEMKTRDEMHKLMQDKGFTKKTAQQKLESLQSERREQQIKKLEQSTSGQSYYGGMMIVYGLVLFAVIGTVFFTKRIQDRMVFLFSEARY